MATRSSVVLTLLLLTSSIIVYPQSRYTISGYVRTSGGAGISGVVLTGLPTPPTTDSTGHYSAYVNQNWTGTVIPAKAGYDITPPSMVYTNVVANLVTNYTGVLRMFTISGYVRTALQAAISDVVMNGLPGSPSTNADGFYSGTVPYGWSSSVVPTKAGCSFVPVSSMYEFVTADRRNNYTGIIQTFTVSGYVQNRAGAGIAGVLMSGLPNNPTTDEKGCYIDTVTYGWGGIVTPTKTGYNFSPASTSYGSIVSNQRTDYLGSIQFFVISGYVRTAAGAGIPDVVMNGLPGNPSTDASGYYLAGVNYGWSGTVTPSKSGYSITQVFTLYSNITSNQSTNYTGTPLSITISGYARTAAGAPLPGVVLSGLPSSPSTDASGFYSVAVSYGWQGTVTPSKGGYTFNPPSILYSNVVSDQINQNYTGTQSQYTISGYVKTAGGIGINGVAMTGLPLTTNTDASGYYSCSVSYGWTGEVSPTKSGYNFSPASLSYNGVSGDQTNQNYTGAQLQYAISGYVRTAAGAAVNGVAMTGLPSTTTTDASGFYSCAVTSQWSGTVTPTKGGNSFAPVSISYASVVANQSNQNYTATMQLYTISGYTKTAAGTGISDVAMIGLPATTSTDARGFYSCAVGYGWSGTVTPTKGGYSFSPAAVSYSSVTSEQLTQDYVGTELQFTISGYVRTAGGAGISGVAMGGLPGSITTDTSGFYSCLVNYGWHGTVTPAKVGFSFSPGFVPYSSVSANQLNQNYTGIPVATFAISGYVRTAAGAGISGVVLNGLPTNPSTDASGFYTSAVLTGWLGTATPTKSGYSFIPSSTSYANVTSDKTNQNYTGAPPTYTISGYVRTSAGIGVAGVSMSGLPGTPGTDGNGFYVGTVGSGWSGTVSPARTGYSFTPASMPYVNIVASQTSDYTATVLTGVEEMSGGASQQYLLLQNYPNPFNPSTIISYYIPWAGVVSLKIFNSLGEEVAMLASGWKEAGYHKVVWQASVPSGFYYYRLQAHQTNGGQSGGFNETRKMVLTK